MAMAEVLSMKRKLFAVLFYATVLGSMVLLGLWGDRTVTAMSMAEPIEGRVCVIIDAGHGMPDGGAVSCTGAYESEINLSIARRLNDLLRLLGYDTKMLRTTSDSVYTEGETIAQKKVSDLKHRVEEVNKTDNGILLSIHQNHYTDGRYSGAQMFYASTQGSQELAKALQEAFVTHLNPGSNRQIKKCQGIYLMEHIQTPGVLVECGFLSNPAEEVKLRDVDYQKKICCVIASALSNYLANT